LAHHAGSQQGEFLKNGQIVTGAVSLFLNQIKKLMSGKKLKKIKKMSQNSAF
jgi:hypothetical protein